MMFDHQLSMI